jgi:hypothetical protein
MKLVSVIAGALLFALPKVEAEAPSAVAIKDAQVVTVSGPNLAKATVLLRDGLIQDVGVNLSIPADAWVIEGAGLTVYPGFIDALSTWGIPGGVVTPRAGSGAPSPSPAPNAGPQQGVQQNQQPRVHGPEERPQTYSFERAADLVSPIDNRLEAVRAAGFTSAATFPNRGIFEGLGAMVNLAGERGPDMVVAQPIGQQIVFRMGRGGLGRTFPSSLMGNIAYVRQLYLDLDQYKRAKQIYAANPAGNRRPEYDHDLEGLAESPRLLLPADQAQQIDRMLRFGQEIKAPFVLYGLHEGYRCLDELKQQGVPVLVSLRWPRKPKDADPNEVPNYRELMMRDQAPAVPAMLAKAGVKFALYSDGLDNAAELRHAVKKAMDAGLSRADAIRALTLSAAEIYGLSDRMGSIEKGKIANLVVIKGDVFEDQSNVEYLFIDGKQFRPSKESQQGPADHDKSEDRSKPASSNDSGDGGGE